MRSPAYDQQEVTARTVTLKTKSMIVKPKAARMGLTATIAPWLLQEIDPANFLPGPRPSSSVVSAPPEAVQQDSGSPSGSGGASVAVVDPDVNAEVAEKEASDSEPDTLSTVRRGSRESRGIMMVVVYYVILQTLNYYYSLRRR